MAAQDSSLDEVPPTLMPAWTLPSYPAGVRTPRTSAGLIWGGGVLGCHGNHGAGWIWGGGVLGCHGNRGAGWIWGGGVLGCHGNCGAGWWGVRLTW